MTKQSLTGYDDNTPSRKQPLVGYAARATHTRKVFTASFSADVHTVRLTEDEDQIIGYVVRIPFPINGTPYHWTHHYVAQDSAGVNLGTTGKTHLLFSDAVKAVTKAYNASL